MVIRVRAVLKKAPSPVIAPSIFSSVEGRSSSASLALPENADLDAISARFNNGLLCLEIKKLAEAKKRVIQIRAK
jgi:HSP20 family molecular chaperone IbpA